MERQLTYSPAGDGRSVVVDFDNNPEARYELQVRPNDHDTGDGVILSVNTQACIAFARLFAQLADLGGHVHLGYSEAEPQGPGVRIVVSADGRSEQTAAR